MTRPKEIPNSLRERPPLERIGSYYLEAAIHEGNSLGGTSSNLQQIQETLHRGIHGELPTELVEKFHFQDLTWFTDTGINLPLFFWAVKDKIPLRTLGPGPRFAVATIEIARKSIPKRGINIPVADDREPIFVRIAGVDQSKRRVVALTYNASEDMDLRHINVSIGDDELRPPEKGEPLIPSVLIENRSGNMQTSLVDPYRDAGFITETMMYQAGTPVISVHRRLLKIPASTFSTDSLQIYDTRGFFLRQEAEMYVIAISKSGRFEDISIPQRLAPAA